MNITKLLPLAVILTFISLTANAQVSVKGNGEETGDTTATATYYQPATRSGYTNPRNGFRYWKDGYTNTKLEFHFGYVNKSWYCKYPSRTQREDYFGDPGKFLHGFHFSLLYTPHFDWGLGLRTGLGFEFYTSYSRWITDWCDFFSEADMYIPVHASYRYSASEDFGFSLFAGPAFQWAMSGRYYKYRGTVYRPSYYYWYRPRNIYDSRAADYGDGWPQRINWQIDLGFTLRYKMAALSFSYSFGLNDHKIENTFGNSETDEIAAPARQDRMQATLAFVF